MVINKLAKLTSIILWSLLFVFIGFFLGHRFGFHKGRVIGRGEELIYQGYTKDEAIYLLKNR